MYTAECFQQRAGRIVDLNIEEVTEGSTKLHIEELRELHFFLLLLRRLN
jgi:hypothetical protein